MNYYLIGERLSHSFSADIHRRFGRYAYELKELAPEELGPFLEARAFAGLNVTVPYKEAVLPYLDRLDDQAAAIGAVNTVVNRNGVLWGYNTDFDGFHNSLRKLLPVVSLRDQCAHWPRQSVSPAAAPRKCLILGTGGTSKTALAVCRTLGVPEIYRVSRTGREGALTYAEASAAHGDADLLINTTPAGMWPDTEGLPLDLAGFPHLAAVFDCVYNPLRTRLVLEARDRGIPAAGGLEMLVRQAAEACARFTGAPVPAEEVDIILSDLRRERETLVLIGMPGSGKTTVGRILAQSLNREFADTDEEIQKRTGKPIPTIFAEDGEAAFRDLEADLVRELSGVGGRVLAVGGGTVLRPDNLRRLRQNGRLILLDRPLEALVPTADRPLGDSREKLRALWETRRPIYLAAADQTICVTGTPEETAERIISDK